MAKYQPPQQTTASGLNTAVETAKGLLRRASDAFKAADYSKSNDLMEQAQDVFLMAAQEAFGAGIEEAGRFVRAQEAAIESRKAAQHEVAIAALQDAGHTKEQAYALLSLSLDA